MKKRILSIMLTLCMMLVLVPQTVLAEENASAAPSVSAYATREQMMDSTFAPKEDGTANNIGKLVFGKKTDGTTSQEWYILGQDNGVSGYNTVIFAASSIVGTTEQNYWMNWSSNWNVDKENSELWKDCTYNSGTTISKVHPNHYGSSDLRDKLQAIAGTDPQCFTAAEKGMMNDTTVTTTDTFNNVDYTTTDKLYALHGVNNGTEIYAGSSNQIKLKNNSYWNTEGVAFWLRSPVVDNVSYSNIGKDGLVLITFNGQCVLYSPACFENDVQPAGNLNLSSVLFASAAEASSDGVAEGKIASGKAMYLRLNGSSKNIGTALYSATTGDIKATKGNTQGDVALVVQGKNGTTDWYYSKKITGTEIVKVSEIESELESELRLSGIDLSTCKIWLETTDSTDGMIYAAEASSTLITDISSVEITGIEVPTVNTKLDANAVCTTKGVSSTTPSVTWTPNDDTAGYNTTYTASVTLTADTFYQFTGSTTATVNGKTANVTKNSDGTLTVTYMFPPTAKDKLTRITAPVPITVDNGTAYTAMGLPDTVAIVTEGGTATSASVEWDTTNPASGSYNPDVLTEQSVTLNGTVTCPETIDQNGVSLDTTITITISAADTVEAPQANPASGTYTSNQSVALSTQTVGADIYYTTDGTTPSRTNGTKYTGPISVTGTEAQSVETTIKAIAVKDKMQDSSVETFTYTIEIPDTTAPTGEIKIDKNIWKTFINEITFGLFFKDTQTVTITASDNSDKDVKIEYVASNKALDTDGLESAAFTTYDKAFNIDPNNKYVIYAKLTDESGNAAYINSDGIVLDSVVPVISGVENGKTYCEAQTVTITEEYIGSVTVNEIEVPLDTNNQFTLEPAEGTQTIVVTDKAGNVSAEMIVTVNDGHRGGTATCRSKAVCKYCGTEYGEFDNTRHINLEKVSAKDATVTETGNIEYWQCKDCGELFSDSDGKNKIEQEDTVIPKLPPEIIKGKGQSMAAGEKNGLSFTSNALYDDFIRVELDGKTLDNKNYTVKEGSTIVTLEADYVATLSVGTHTIGIVSNNGTATTTFTINAKAAADKDAQSPKSPQSGDHSMMLLWITLLFVSGALLTVMGIYCKKKKHNR